MRTITGNAKASPASWLLQKRTGSPDTGSGHAASTSSFFAAMGRSYKHGLDADL
ncbi:hypothetical protein [Zestomonas carbonaria]|uniref:hypothetical protein n=1 Tax=Zestomonas carbonaria TaxID=2762745 RepID=UPI001656EA3A|nr:hypothetical protein [Pseudomonas carbonaria]